MPNIVSLTDLCRRSQPLKCLVRATAPHDCTQAHSRTQSARPSEGRLRLPSCIQFCKSAPTPWLCAQSIKSSLLCDHGSCTRRQGQRTLMLTLTDLVSTHLAGKLSPIHWLRQPPELSTLGGDWRWRHRLRSESISSQRRAFPPLDHYTSQISHHRGSFSGRRRTGRFRMWHLHRSSLRLSQDQSACASWPTGFSPTTELWRK